jgi:1,4-alpha-glucan branching enzyme
MDFVLALHSHLPYVLNHGRWPHGSDWICEAAIDTYLPLYDVLHRLQAEEIAAPVTLGITPILANQLESQTFATELETYFDQRLTTCEEADESLRSTGDTHLLPLAHYWKVHLTGLRNLFRRVDRNLAKAFRGLQDAGRLELISCGATHGFLPLLARDESIRLQLGLGRAEHRRIFGRLPDGLWLPECAYRPQGVWAPLPSAPGAGSTRRGIEEHVAEAGFRYFFVDSHLAAAGHAFRLYGADWGEWRLDPAARRPGGAAPRPSAVEAEEVELNSPYQAYRVAGPRGATMVSALIRDPVASKQVWSRQEGYPGDEWYLEFHKIRWPGGLKYWRVSAPGSDLGQKEPYDPARALERAGNHARHFVSLLGRIATEVGGPPTASPPSRRAAGSLIAVPFDTELFGHWWHEGVEFLAQVYRALDTHPVVRPTTAREHLAAATSPRGIHLTQGSWGANGDFSMWLNSQTDWTWPRLWAIETTFWERAPAALASPSHRPVLAQAAREMLLAMGSDWQFIISTGAVTDYAVKRFTEHCADAEFLISALTPASGDLAGAQTRAQELWQRDQVFPDVLDAVRAALDGSSTATR